MTDAEWRRYKRGYYTKMTLCYLGLCGCAWAIVWLFRLSLEGCP